MKGARGRMKIDVSVGEAVDRLTILLIKMERMKSSEKLAHVALEYQTLNRSLQEIGVQTDSSYFQVLRTINSELWDIENRLRLKEAAGEFDADFVELARKVYLLNDRRWAEKCEINRLFPSDVKEEKEYPAYDTGCDAGG
jgi:hypothetical protein